MARGQGKTSMYAALSRDVSRQYELIEKMKARLHQTESQALLAGFKEVFETNPDLEKFVLSMSHSNEYDDQGGYYSSFHIYPDVIKTTEGAWHGEEAYAGEEDITEKQMEIERKIMELVEYWDGASFARWLELGEEEAKNIEFDPLEVKEISGDYRPSYGL